MEFKDKLHILRKNKKISQAKMAEILNVHQTAISQWECGKTRPDIELLPAVAELLGTTVSDLLGTEETKKDTTPQGDVSVNAQSATMEVQNAIQILCMQYDIPYPIMDNILGCEKNRSEKIVSGMEPATDSEYERVSDFFGIPLDDLKRGRLPIKVNGAVYMKILADKVQDASARFK